MDLLKEKFDKFLPYLNEKQRRLYLLSEAEALGRGGKTLVSKLAKISRPTLNKAQAEFASNTIPKKRVRRVGGGRKKITETHKGLLEALESLVDPDSRGHPESPLCWTIKSFRTLSKALEQKGYKVGKSKIGDLLTELGYSLQSNRKKVEGKQHPDRDSQFHYINQKCQEYLSAGLPVISVDTKKKEWVGNYKNNGKDYAPKGEAKSVEMHDFGKVKAVPYGVYDIAENNALVNVGMNFDTAQFAVASIRSWWTNMGSLTYANATKILINADEGGSNGHRLRLWKIELQKLADELGLEITVCHFPPGTSKWNKIEHRLFSQISLNWRGVPLIDYETVVQLIGSVTTRKGLKVVSKLDQTQYKKGIKISDRHLNQINLFRHKFHGDWNYTISPKCKT